MASDVQRELKRTRQACLNCRCVRRASRDVLLKVSYMLICFVMDLTGGKKHDVRVSGLLAAFAFALAKSANTPRRIPLPSS